MRIGWIGFHLEGLAPLRAVLESGYAVEGAITLDGDRAAAKSGSVDYAGVCREFGVPLYRVGSINGEDGLEALHYFRCLDGMTARSYIQMKFGFGQAQLVKEYLGHLVIIMLTRMDKRFRYPAFV